MPSRPHAALRLRARRTDRAGSAGLRESVVSTGPFVPPLLPVPFPPPEKQIREGAGTVGPMGGEPGKEGVVFMLLSDGVDIAARIAIGELVPSSSQSSSAISTG